MKKKIMLSLALLPLVAIIPVLYTITNSNPTIDDPEPTQTTVPEDNVTSDALSSIYEPIYDTNSDLAYYSYVYFGLYPQKVITGQALTEDIIKAEYDSNQEAVIANKKYRRIQISDTQLPGEINSQDNISYYNWNEGGDTKGYHYFLYEPIKWRVLSVDGSTLFLMADSILDTDVYSSANYGSWYNSNIRSWLNGYDVSKNDSRIDYSSHNFLDSALSEGQKKAIIEKNEDFASLLTSYDMLRETYGFNRTNQECKSRILAPSDYAFAKGASTGNSTARSSKWWLQDSNNGVASMVNWDGKVYKFSLTERYEMTSKHTGICPVIYLDTSLTNEWSPYIPVPNPPVITSKAKSTPESVAPPNPALVAADIHNPIYKSVDKKEYSYIFFGEYPQAEITGTALTDEIVNAKYNSNGDATVSKRKYAVWKKAIPC